MSTHLSPYEFMSVVDFADHMEGHHGLDHSTAYNRDRYQLNDLHIKAHYESSRTQTSELRSQLEEALGIIKDLEEYSEDVTEWHDYERITVLRLKQ